MNREETADLLRQRWTLTDQNFDGRTVDTWHQTLTDIDPDEANAALITLTRSTPTVSAAQLLHELARRSQRRHPSTTEPRPCGCPEIRGRLCPHEIETGLTHIARIRSEMK